MPKPIPPLPQYLSSQLRIFGGKMMERTRCSVGGQYTRVQQYLKSTGENPQKSQSQTASGVLSIL